MASEQGFEKINMDMLVSYFSEKNISKMYTMWTRQIDCASSQRECGHAMYYETW